MNPDRMSRLAQLDAAHQAQVSEQWHDWRRYLQAQLRLLGATEADASRPPSFEQDDAWEVQRERAVAELHRIPTTRRQLFERERERRRQELQQARRAEGVDGTSLDPAALDRETLTVLLNEANGVDGERGLVPMGDGRWYEVHVPTLLAAPSEAEYCLDGLTDQRRVRQRLLVIAGCLLLMLIGVWLTWPRPASHLAALSAPVISVNGEQVEPWPLHSVTITDSVGMTTTLPVQLATGLSWPDLESTTPRAFVRSSSTLPQTLCVPSNLVIRAASVEVASRDELPRRSYQLLAEPPVHPDLVVESCAASTAMTRRYGVLLSTGAPLWHAMEQPVDLPGGQVLKLRALQVLGPEQDRELPAGRVRVVVELDAPDDVDVNTLSPTLLLADGTAVLPATTPRSETISELRYLIPSFDTPVDAAWSVTPPGGASTLRWDVTLTPPLSHADLLRQALRVTEVTARRESDVALRMSIGLHNSSSTPLSLAPGDLRLMDGSTQVTLPAVPEIQTPLAANERRTITLSLSGPAGSSELELIVGSERFRMRW